MIIFLYWDVSSFLKLWSLMSFTGCYDWAWKAHKLCLLKIPVDRRAAQPPGLSTAHWCTDVFSQVSLHSCHLLGTTSCWAVNAQNHWSKGGCNYISMWKCVSCIKRIHFFSLFSWGKNLHSSEMRQGENGASEFWRIQLLLKNIFS